MLATPIVRKQNGYMTAAILGFAIWGIQSGYITPTGVAYKGKQWYPKVLPRLCLDPSNCGALPPAPNTSLVASGCLYSPLKRHTTLGVVQANFPCVPGVPENGVPILDADPPHTAAEVQGTRIMQCHI